MMTVTVEFTQQEVAALQQLLDIAVKAGGLQVAGAALEIMQKVGQAIQAQKSP